MASNFKRLEKYSENVEMGDNLAFYNYVWKLLQLDIQHLYDDADDEEDDQVCYSVYLIAM
jgi:hypothetical protein